MNAADTDVGFPDQFGSTHWSSPPTRSSPLIPADVVVRGARGGESLPASHVAISGLVRSVIPFWCPEVQTSSWVKLLTPKSWGGFVPTTRPAPLSPGQRSPWSDAAQKSDEKPVAQR